MDEIPEDEENADQLNEQQSASSHGFPIASLDGSAEDEDQGAPMAVDDEADGT